MANTHLEDSIEMDFPLAINTTEASTETSALPLACDVIECYFTITPYTTGNATCRMQTLNEDTGVWTDFWAFTITAGGSAFEKFAYFPAESWEPKPVGTGTSPSLAAGTPAGPHPRSTIRFTITSPGAIVGEGDAAFACRIRGYNV